MANQARRDVYSPRPQKKRGPGIRAVDPATDQKLLEQIGYLLTADDDLDAPDVDVDVAAGIVTLTGSVSSKEIKRRCGEIAEQASGHAAVNQLKVTRG